MKQRKFYVSSISTVLFVLSSVTSFAKTTQSAPQIECLAGKKSIPVNDEQALEWKSTTSNQFQSRAHVQGPIVQLYPDHSGHTHFSIAIGSGPHDTLEIIYNQSFGALPPLQIGMTVEACGDYITSYAQSGPYPPSPDGAILHWVHKNPNGKGHNSGFLIIEDNLYGQGNGRGN